MIVAGEASGDKHGAQLIAALRALRPHLDWEFFGAGGEEMRAAGVETLVDAHEVAIMGALEVATSLPKFLRAFRRLRAAARVRRPRAAVLIDWPEFNLRLARRLKRDGRRVIYYISPQVWAWRSYRVNAIKRDVERMLVILPFERDYYERAGVQVDYVGHPLLDSLRVTASREEFCARYGLDPARPVIALLPGSRRTELKFILPPLVEAMGVCARSRPDLQFALVLAPAITRIQTEMMAEVIAAAGSLPGLRLIENDAYNALAAAQLAVVASGTATLEAAIIGTPLIIVYRASGLNWRLFWPLVNVPFVGLPNLIAGRQIALELLQNDLTGERLAAHIIAWLDDETRLARLRNELAEVRQRLGEAQASERAARRILDLLGL
jgi:lipid-A-disaccharide synthase